MRTHSQAENKAIYIINTYKNVDDRLRALKDAGFNLEYCWVKGGYISTVHHLKRKKIYRIQVTPSEFHGKYQKAYCVVIPAANISDDEKGI